MSTKKFDLGDVLSITTGRLVSRRHMDGVYDILSFMCGESLFTHALPRASRECAPKLLEQHPGLADIEVPEELNKDNYEAWLDSLAEEHGTELEVAPLADGEHEVIDPLEEMTAMMGGDKSRVIPVVISDER
jgi:hypothetical protein